MKAMLCFSLSTNIPCDHEISTPSVRVTVEPFIKSLQSPDFEMVGKSCSHNALMFMMVDT